MNLTAPGFAAPMHSRLRPGPLTFRHALTVALTLHGLMLLGVGWSHSQTNAPSLPPPYLDVTLVKQPGADTPVDAESLAQFDQQGSGDDASWTQAVTRAAEPPQNTLPEVIEAGLRQQASTRVLKVLSVHTGLNAAEAVSEDLPATSSEQRAALRAQLQQAQQLYSRMPRTLRTTALSAQAASHAGYLADWVERVEAVGNQYYPAAARQQQLYGELQLAATLLPDGHIAAIEILRSSGHAILDQAAQETLRRAAPFAPFPADMAAEWDRFEIIRTWQFISGNAVNTLP